MSQTDEGLEDLPEDEEDYEEEEYEEEEDEDQWSVYDSSTFISGSYQSENSTINEDILKFEYLNRNFFKVLTFLPFQFFFWI